MAQRFDQLSEMLARRNQISAEKIQRPGPRPRQHAALQVGRHCVAMSRATVDANHDFHVVPIIFSGNLRFSARRLAKFDGPRESAKAIRCSLSHSPHPDPLPQGENFPKLFAP